MTTKRNYREAHRVLRAQIVCGEIDGYRLDEWQKAVMLEELDDLMQEIEAREYPDEPPSFF